MITQSTLLEDSKEGVSFVAKNVKKALNKFHYYRNGWSLCGKYEQPETLLSLNMLFENELCSKCRKKYESVM